MPEPVYMAEFLALLSIVGAAAAAQVYATLRMAEGMLLLNLGLLEGRSARARLHLSIEDRQMATEVARWCRAPQLSKKVQFPLEGRASATVDTYSSHTEGFAGPHARPRVGPRTTLRCQIRT